VGGVLQPGSGRFATSVSALTFIYGSTRVFVQIQDALNTIWDIDPQVRPTIFKRLRRRSAAFFTTLLAGALLLVFVIVLPSVQAITPFIGELPGARFIWHFADFFLTWLLVAFTFGLIYKVLPNVMLVWSDVWIGALIAALAFIAAQGFVVWYLSTSALSSVYGAAGSFIVVLFWLYISAQILMLGAEISQMFTVEHGSHAKLARAMVEPLPGSSK
jgi:membrane protein